MAALYLDKIRSISMCSLITCQLFIDDLLRLNFSNRKMAFKIKYKCYFLTLHLLNFCINTHQCIS